MPQGRHRRHRRPPKNRRREEEKQEEPSGGSEESEEVGRDASRKDRPRATIRRHLLIAAKLKKMIETLEIKRPVRWQARQEKLRMRIRKQLDAARALGWSPKRAPKKGKDGKENVDEFNIEDEANELPPEEGEDQAPEPSEEEVEGANWMDDDIFGADVPKPWQKLANLARNSAGKLIWVQPMALGDKARVVTRPGHRAAVIPVKPGLFLVQIVSTPAIQRVAKVNGCEVGIVPILLAPKIISAAKKALAPKQQPPAAAPAPAPVAPAKPAADEDVGCDRCNK